MRTRLPSGMPARRKAREGTVVSNEWTRLSSCLWRLLTRHPLYGKTMRRSKKFKAHDEENRCLVGDLVRIRETRPLSKEKTLGSGGNPAASAVRTRGCGTQLSPSTSRRCARIGNEELATDDSAADALEGGRQHRRTAIDGDSGAGHRSKTVRRGWAM